MERTRRAGPGQPGVDLAAGLNEYLDNLTFPATQGKGALTTLPRRSFQLSNLISLNLLLIFLPLALLGRALQWGDPVLFIMAALAIVPLSGLLGEATEVLAARLGQRAGGLINATLGNAAGLMITVFALRAGLLELVRASI